MKRAARPCPRLFEAEAMRDGRLAGAERVRFERHAATCGECAREVRALEALGEALRADRREETADDELHARRERTRLLAAFDRSLVEPSRGGGAWRRVVGPAVALALVVVAAAFWRSRVVVPSVTAPKAIVHADAAAVWSEHVEADREEIVLQRGALWIHAEHSGGPGRLVVVLPDGELEDTGTIFTVSAEDGHTTGVSVQEGSVVLRIRGESPVAIGAGGTWSGGARRAASAAASASASAAPASSVATSPPPSPPSPSVEPRPIASPTRIALPAAPTASVAAPVAASIGTGDADDASAALRSAMDAFDRGDDREAAAEFATFLEKHPGAPQAEDAAYLRVIALQRSGDAASTKQAAQDYLRRFPAGFRRTEVEALAGSK